MRILFAVYSQLSVFSMSVTPKNSERLEDFGTHVITTILSVSQSLALEGHSLITLIIETHNRYPKTPCSLRAENSRAWCLMPLI